MKSVFSKEEFAFIHRLMDESGRIAQNIQKSGLTPERKSDKSIVTAADYKVQEHIIKELSVRFPLMNFIHEENFDKRMCNVDNDTISAVIDPIDGTAMFSMYLPFWCVSLGFFKGYTPLYGFVNSPGCDLYFYNDSEKAYCNHVPLVVDEFKEIDRETNLFYSSEAEKQYNISFPGKVRNLGSTALHACLIADNRRNRSLAFIGQSFLWDWAGAIPVVLKSGASICYMDGSKIDYKAVMENNYHFEKNILAYTVKDFTTVKSYFTKK